jgi:hypothetical protein
MSADTESSDGLREIIDLHKMLILLIVGITTDIKIVLECISNSRNWNSLLTLFYFQ